MFESTSIHATSCCCWQLMDATVTRL